MKRWCGPRLPSRFILRRQQGRVKLTDEVRCILQIARRTAEGSPGILTGESSSFSYLLNHWDVTIS